MQGWSWMAALMLSATMAANFNSACLAGEPTSLKQTVKLSLRIDGISREDGEVLIKPGHPGCRFKPISFRVSDQPRDAYDMINLVPFEIETRSADRDCSFAITLREPGKPDKTVRRNLLIVPTPEGQTASPQQLRCYVSSNSGPKSTPLAEKSDDLKRKK